MTVASTVEKTKSTWNHSMIKDNFDINIWNRGAYFSEELPTEECYDEWVLCPYVIEETDAGYGTGKYLDEYNLELTEEEAKRLTLGWGIDLGGDYVEDDDTWLDMQSFKLIYKDIPPRVSEWIDTVLELL